MSDNPSPPKPMHQLRLRYQRTLEVSLIISLLILSLLFYSFKTFKPKNQIPGQSTLPTIVVITPPQTKQLYRAPAPILPPIPVPSDDPEISDEVTVDYSEIDIGQLIKDSGAPPPDDQEEAIPFVLVSEKPQIITKVQPVYPELARKAGIEGMVVVEILIDKKGNVEKAGILKSVPMLDDAALDAARQCKFKPGKQRDKYVKVKMSMPFSFRLK